jgi:stage II sporulation protein M
MKKQQKKQLKIVKIIKEHITNNAKEYLKVAIIFLIGIILGVIFVNYIQESKQTEITNYLTNFVNSLNNEYQIDVNSLFKESAISNLILALIIWFIGSTVIGIPIVYLIICARGFCFGYTISAIMITYSTWKGILFSITALLLQNIIFIPSLLALGVSGIRVYKSIIKDKRRENIKLELIRHTIFSTFMTILLVASSFLEAYVSSNIFSMLIQVFI